MEHIKEIVYEKRLEILNNYFSINNELLNKDSELYRILPIKLLYPYIKKGNKIDWHILSCNPSITTEFIENNLELLLNDDIIQRSKWIWFNLSYNMNIKDEFIKLHSDKEWYWDYLSKTRSLSFIDKNREYINWYNASKNPNLTIEYIENNLDIPWNFDALSCNNIITPEFVEKYIDKEWDWNYLSYNSSITTDFIEKYIHKEWSWYLISLNVNITDEFLESHKDKLHWKNVSSTLNFDILENHLDKINWNYLNYNNSINLNIIEKYIECPWKDEIPGSSSQHPRCGWNWNYLSLKSYITCDFIEKYIDKDWNYEFLSFNPNITLEFIIKHINKGEWNWYNISKNINISFNDFINNKDLPWTYKLFLNNNIFKIDIHDPDYIEEVNKYMAIKKIKRKTREATCNPEYKLARKKIKEMFEEVI